MLSIVASMFYMTPGATGICRKRPPQWRISMARIEQHINIISIIKYQKSIKKSQQEARTVIEAVISIKIPGIWLTALNETYDVDVRVLDVIPYGEHGIQDLVEIKMEEGQLDEIVDFIKGVEGVEDATLEIVEQNKAIGIVKTKMCNGCRAIFQCDCHLISCRSMEGGKMEMQIIADDRAILKRLIDKWEEYGASPKLIKLSSIKDEDMLTGRQERIVRTAYERGYYDFPKRVGVKELAEMFEVSTATLSEILRRGQKKIIEDYFEKR